MGDTDADLRTLLEDALSHEAGARRVIRDMRCSPGCYHSSFEIQDVDLTLDDGTALQVVVKFAGSRGLMRQAASVKPAFLIDPRREALVYKNIPGPLKIDAPRFLGAAGDPATDRYVLVLERIDGTPLWQIGDFDVWKAAARWLAWMHDAARPHAAELSRATPLIHYDAGYYRQWMRRAARFLSAAPPPSQLDRFLRLAERYEPLVQRLVGLPKTFIHGEFQPSNVLVQGESPALRIRPVDWELAAIAPALMDLADLTGGNWSNQQREDLADTYHDASAFPRTIGRVELLEALDLCRLHRAVQWLGWSANWSPPQEHRHDWLGVALELGEQLQ